jgi:HK97 family phage major capsid protein
LGTADFANTEVAALGVGEVGGDFGGAEGAFVLEMSKLITAGYTDLIASQTATGTAPNGIFTDINAHNSPVTEVTCATNGEINAIDIRAIMADLPERYRPRASWFMNVSVENEVRAFANGNNHSDFTVNLQEEGVSLLNGKRVLLSDYSTDFSSTTTVTTAHMVLGDFRHFVIAQRVGLTVEPVQTVFAANQRPTGQRGLFAYTRVAHGSVVDNAFRTLINVSI